jgi:WhiB family redox-sensing transcriptional regulator
VSVYDDTKWMVDARCRGSDWQMFFPTEHGSSTEDSREAKAICHQCKVETECRDYAVGDPSLKGIWGGTSDRERKAIRRARRKEAQ